VLLKRKSFQSSAVGMSSWNRHGKDKALDMGMMNCHVDLVNATSSMDKWTILISDSGERMGIHDTHQHRNVRRRLRDSTYASLFPFGEAPRQLHVEQAHKKEAQQLGLVDENSIVCH